MIFCCSLIGGCNNALMIASDGRNNPAEYYRQMDLSGLRFKSDCRLGVIATGAKKAFQYYECDALLYDTAICFLFEKGRSPFDKKSIKLPTSEMEGVAIARLGTAEQVQIKQADYLIVINVLTDRVWFDPRGTQRLYDLLVSDGVPKWQSIQFYKLNEFLLGRPENLEAELVRDSLGSKYFKQHRAEVIDSKSAFASKIGKLALSVRAATRDELPDVNERLGLILAAEGAGSLTLGLIAPPMYASALVVGGGLNVPGGLLIYIHDKKVRNAIGDALGNVKVIETIHRSLKRHINEAFEEEKLPDIKIAFIVEAYGLVESSMWQHCFVVLSNLIISSDQLILAQENLLITQISRSEDAPPPQCAPFERWSDDNAAYLTATINEYADVLAVMTVDRVAKVVEK